MIKNYCKPAKLIVCLLVRGQSHAVLESLNTSGHILASEFVANRHINGIADSFECNEGDLLRIIVEPQYADKVFEELYHLAGISGNKGAYMYQQDIPLVTPYELPSIPQQGVLVSALQDGESLPAGLDEKTAKHLRALVGLDKA